MSSSRTGNSQCSSLTRLLLSSAIRDICVFLVLFSHPLQYCLGWLRTPSPPRPTTRLARCYRHYDRSTTPIVLRTSSPFSSKTSCFTFGTPNRCRETHCKVGLVDEIDSSSMSLSPEFDTSLAVILAGYSFEAYNEPVRFPSAPFPHSSIQVTRSSRVLSSPCVCCLCQFN